MRQQIINDIYSEYISNDISRAELEGLIHNYLFYNQEKTCLNHWEREEYEDYLSWFYPRLHKAIDSYRDIGASFEAFIAKFLLISSKEYRINTTSKSITEYSVWSAQVPDMYLYEEPSQYKTPAANSGGYINKKIEEVITSLVIDKKGRKNTRRLLALILKCYHYVSEDLAERIAPKLGIETGELLDMLKKLSSLRQKRDDKIYKMKERTHSQFLRCLIYEKKLSLLKENETAYNELEIRLIKARIRLEKMRKRLTSTRTEATNKPIAEIIGISKGTVDASLYRLKAKWELMAKNAKLN